MKDSTQYAEIDTQEHSLYLKPIGRSIDLKIIIGSFWKYVVFFKDYLSFSAFSDLELMAQEDLDNFEQQVVLT